MKVVHVVGADAPESIPAELAAALGEVIDVTTWVLEPHAVGRFATHLRRESPDLIHVHHTTSGLAAALAARRWKVPVVQTIHRDVGRLTRRSRVAVCTTANIAHHLVWNSSATRAAWHRTVARRRSTPGVVIPNGVDAAAVLSAAAPVDPPVGPLLVTPARLVPEKAHDTVLDALAHPGRDIHWVVVGDGPLRSNLEQRCRALGLSSCVTFTGRLSRRATYGWLAAADAVIMVSVTEGFCNAVAEAMVAGCPLVVSDLPALRETTADGAAYVPVGDVGALRRAIDDLVSDLAVRRAAAQEIAPAAAARFDLRGTVDAHVELYRHVLAER